MDEEVDGMVGGSKEKEREGRGFLCFLISHTQILCWHLIFAVINVFRVRHISAKSVSYLLLI